MADLIVVSFDDEFKADQVRVDLMKMQHAHRIDLEEAAIVVRKTDGGVREFFRGTQGETWGEPCMTPCGRQA